MKKLWKDRAPFLLTLLLLILTVEPFSIDFASWIAFTPALICIFARPRPATDMLLGYGIGFIASCAMLEWVFPTYSSIALQIVLIISCAYALFFGALSVCALSVRSLRSRKIIFLSVLPSVLWVGIWFLFTNNPAGPILLEVPFYQSLPFLQVVSFGGIESLIALIIFVNTALALGWVHRNKLSFKIFSVAITLTLIIFGLGALRLSLYPYQEGETTVALVQTNLPYDKNWRSSHIPEMEETYRALARTAADNGASMIIFPQYTMWFDAMREDFFVELSRETNATIALATYIPTQTGKPLEEGLANIGMIFSPRKGLVGAYRSVVGPPLLERNQEFGDEFPELETPLGKVGLLLCYEDTTRWVVAKWKPIGVSAFLTLTNPSAFLETVHPRYHLFQDRLRALETGKLIFRVTPNGYSAAIDPLGRILEKSNMNTEEILYVHAAKLE